METILIPIVCVLFFFFAGIRIVRPTSRGLDRASWKIQSFCQYGI